MRKQWLANPCMALNLALDLKLSMFEDPFIHKDTENIEISLLQQGLLTKNYIFKEIMVYIGFVEELRELHGELFLFSY